MMTDAEAKWIVTAPNIAMLAIAGWQSLQFCRSMKAFREASVRFETSAVAKYAAPQDNRELQELVERIRKRNSNV